MKKILCAFMLVTVAIASQAQSDYKSAVGGRFGTTYYDIFSFSFKTFITDPGALEFNVGFGSRSRGSYNTGSVSAAISYQHHFDIGQVEGLRWFVGGGATIFNTFSKRNEYEGFGFGIFPTGGVDYKFSNIPLAVSADIRPTVHVTGPGYYNSFYGNFGLAARYTLGSR